MKRTAVVGVVIAAATLTACGGSTTPPSIATLGQQLDCLSTPEVSQPTEMFARETATCDFSMPDQSSQRAIITTFADSDAQANYAKAVDSLGGTRVNGKLWTVAFDGQVAGAAAQKRLGGTLK
jgi:hypothetical protein